MSLDRKQMAERSERKQQWNAFVDKGWVSTGDLAYVLQRRIEGSKTNVIDRNVYKIIDTILSDKGEDYRTQNYHKVGMKTFVSPEFIAEIEKGCREMYKLRKPS